MRFRRKGRSWTALAAVTGVWAALLLAYLWLDAAPWIVAILGLLTLPALWDFALERNAGMEITDTGITWFTGRRTGTLPRTELDHVRLNRRLDLTMRVSLVTGTGARVRLPQECVPPLPGFEAALADAGIRIERHPFSLL